MYPCNGTYVSTFPYIASILGLKSKCDISIDNIVLVFKLLYMFIFSPLDLNLIGRAEDWKIMLWWGGGVSWLHRVRVS